MLIKILFLNWFSEFYRSLRTTINQTGPQTQRKPDIQSSLPTWQLNQNAIKANIGIKRALCCGRGYHFGLVFGSCMDFWHKTINYVHCYSRHLWAFPSSPYWVNPAVNNEREQRYTTISHKGSLLLRDASMDSNWIWLDLWMHTELWKL